MQFLDRINAISPHSPRGALADIVSVMCTSEIAEDHTALLAAIALAEQRLGCQLSANLRRQLGAHLCAQSQRVREHA